MSAPNETDWQTLHTYWFGPSIEPSFDYVQTRLPIWFFRNPAADATICSRFAPWLDLMTEETKAAWKQTPRGFLALILLFDQVPRNAFRGQPESFQFDDYVRGLAERFIAQDWVKELSAIEAFWLFLPFQHHEDRASQQISVEGVAAQGARCPEGHQKFFGICDDMAVRHQDAIERFGRFPHRNPILGREPTADELRFLDDPKHHF